MSRKNQFSEESYARFARRYFRSIYRWCTENGTSDEAAEIAAQRILLALYHLDEGAAEAA